MKKIILGVLLVTSTVLFSQEKGGEIHINHKKDDMTKNEYYFPSRNLVYADTITKGGELKVQAFGTSLTLEKKKDLVYFDGINVKASDFGCSENSELIILFD